MSDPQHPPHGNELLIPNARIDGGPGELLHSAREAAGLSLDDVAGLTKISVLLLQAIEHGDFARLGQPVYVRGYLRKYARALNVSETDVLTSYDAREAPRKPQIEQMLPERRPQQKDDEPQGSSAMAWVLLLVVAAVAGGTIWYLGGSKLIALRRPPAAAPRTVAPAEPAEPQSSTPAPEVTPAPDAATPPAAQDSAPAVAPAPAPASAAPETARQPVAAPPSANPAGPAAPPPINQPEPAPAAPAPKAQATPAEVPSAAEAGTTAPPPNRHATAHSATPQLALSFHDKTWVQIKDARSKILLNGLVQAGRTAGMTGVAPYSITLGRAAAVNVRYQGQPVDLAPFTSPTGAAFLSLPLADAPAAVREAEAQAPPQGDAPSPDR